VEKQETRNGTSSEGLPACIEGPFLKKCMTASESNTGQRRIQTNIPCSRPSRTATPYNSSLSSRRFDTTRRFWERQAVSGQLRTRRSLP
jgi:hypothetical protein